LHAVAIQRNSCRALFVEALALPRRGAFQDGDAKLFAQPLLNSGSSGGFAGAT
jgi:hypothetical protein